LAFAQLILFVVLPRKPKQRPPFIRLFYKIRRCCSTEKDIISTDVEAIAGKNYIIMPDYKIP